MLAAKDFNHSYLSANARHMLDNGFLYSKALEKIKMNIENTEPFHYIKTYLYNYAQLARGLQLNGLDNKASAAGASFVQVLD